MGHVLEARHQNVQRPNMQVNGGYVDDMLIKIKKVAKHISDLDKTFQILRHYKMKLNSAKCTFSVSSGKFLGYLVNHKGVEASLEKIQDF